jgi:hypothetical protein
MPRRRLFLLLAVPTALAALLAGCGGAEDASAPAETTTAETTTTEPQASVTYEYHDEYGHGHCSVTELAAGDEVVLCVAATDGGTRIACFTREEASGSRNAMGLLRLTRAGEVAEQEEWPDECAEGLEVVDPSAGAAVGGY